MSGKKSTHEDLIQREFAFLRSTIGDFQWLSGLTEKELDILHDQIISVFLEFNQSRQTREDNRPFYRLPEV
ncbi:MAG: hypothetical protein GWN16_12585 [Calditrichae bacterium]|nr:hypothetical protein [Calditrichia bacterium]